MRMKQLKRKQRCIFKSIDLELLQEVSYIVNTRNICCDTVNVNTRLKRMCIRLFFDFDESSVLLFDFVQSVRCNSNKQIAIELSIKLRDC